MSNTDESGAGAAATEGPHPATKPAFRCEAPELRTILQQIANHISEADRRHSDALGAMQERLAELGRDAEKARSRLPEAMSFELDRIEDDMAALAERMAASEECPRDGQRLAADRAAEPPPPAGEGDAARDQEPWDRDSAEALTRIYESDVAGMAGCAADQSGALYDDDEPPHAARPDADAGSAHWVDVGRERMLLEERCADIASRVEKALAEIRRECAFAELGNRFERLERHVGGAMAGIADHTEQEALARIEAQIAELSGRFGAVQIQAARLDGIEAELRTLGERTSDDRLAELFRKSAAALPSVPTETVAERVAERLSAQLPRADQTHVEERKRLEELHELVSGFLGERREGDAQTATVLDTMQQAMIRLLDRMDAVEEAAVATVPMAARSLQDGESRSSDQPEQAKAREYGQWGTARDQDMPHAVGGREQRYDPAIFQMYPEPGAAARGQAEAGSDRGPRRGVPGTSDAAPTSWQGERLGFVPPQQDAQNVVAAARRAMRGTAQAETGEAAIHGGAEYTPPNPSFPVKERYSGAIRRSWSPSRLFIVAVAVILAGATFAVGTMLRKQMVDETGEHILLLPQDEGVGAPKGGTRDAGRGGKAGKAPERQYEPDSGSHGDRTPDLKQRSGESPLKMHASTEDPTAARQGEAGAAPAAIANDTGLASGNEGSRPGQSAPMPAWGPAEMPAGVTLQETGSITPVAKPSQPQPARRYSNLSYRPSGAAPEGELQTASLMPDGATETSAGGPVGNAHTLHVLPPAAVGPQSLRVAAAGGDPSAAFEVGARLAEGRGLPQDLAQAAVWYQRAAARGFAPAQYRLATLLERGLGVTGDLGRARDWYLRAAEQGHAKAMHNVAVLSIGGDRAVPDYATAIAWFTKSAERGLADSQYNLGVLYESGLGVARDSKAAYKWFALAALAGDSEAARRRDLLKARVSASQLAQIDRAIRSWRAEAVDPAVNEPRVAGTLWQRRDP